MLLKLENKLSTKTTSSQPQLMRPDSRSTTNEGLIHGSLRTPLCNRRKSPESKCEPDFILFCRPSGKWQVFGGFKKHSLCCCLTLAVKANRTFSSHTSEAPVTRTEGRVTSVPLPAGFTKPQIFYWLKGRLFCAPSQCPRTHNEIFESLVLSQKLFRTENCSTAHRQWCNNSINTEVIELVLLANKLWKQTRSVAVLLWLWWSLARSASH